MRTTPAHRSRFLELGAALRRASLVLVILLGLLAWPTTAEAATVTLRGRVACEGSHEVVGLWVYSSAGGSRFATLTDTSARWVKNYSVSIPAKTNIRLDVGCGGTASSWWSNNRTDLRYVANGGKLSAACKEASGSPARRCSFWGSTIFVGMPFAGVWNKYSQANPGSHPVYDSLGYADWSTDLFAAPGTAVRPRIYPPVTSATYDTRVMNTWTGCAGRGVRLGVYKDGSLVGTVSFAHLAEMPSFSAGQKVTNSTVLGKLKRWPKCSAWQVTSDAGVHTHIEVGTKSGKACYMPYAAGKSLIDTRKIGKIIPGTTASC